MTDFLELKPDGSVTHIRSLRQSSMIKCPYSIMMPEHYRADESCRCDDPTHNEMSEWGYVWDGSLWADGRFAVTDFEEGE